MSEKVGGIYGLASNNLLTNKNSFEKLKKEIMVAKEEVSINVKTKKTCKIDYFAGFL